MRRPAILGFLAALALLLGAPAALAQHNREANQYSARHTTLRRATLRLDLGPYEHGLNDSGILLGPYDESAYGLRFTHYPNDTHAQLGIGLAYGIVDSVEIGVLAVPLNFAQGQVYGDLAGYVRWAFVDERVVQIGLQGLVQAPTWSHVGFGVGLPMNFNAGRIVRIETGVELEVVFDDVDRDGDGTNEQRLALDVPIALAVNIRPRGFLGAKADLLWDQIAGDADTFRAGVGAFGGYSILSRKVPYIDFTGQMMGYFRGEVFTWELVLGTTFGFGL